MKREALTLLRIAVAVDEKPVTDRINQELVKFAIQTDCEIDIAEIGEDFSALERQINNIDLAIMDYKFLNQNKVSLSELYKHNPDCLSVPIGMPEGKICEYLSLRPGGHLRTADENLELHKICNLCMKQLKDNDKVLQIATKKGLFAISLRSVLYCQSDLKYITLVTEGSLNYRKLGTLDDLSEKFPRNFVRVHQSFIVNFQQVCGIDKSTHELLLNGGVRIPFSRAYQTFVLQLYQNGIFNVQL